MIGLIKVNGSVSLISCYLLILDPVILKKVWFAPAKHIKKVRCHHSGEFTCWNNGC